MSLNNYIMAFHGTVFRDGTVGGGGTNGEIQAGKRKENQRRELNK